MINVSRTVRLIIALLVTYVTRPADAAALTRYTVGTARGTYGRPVIVAPTHIGQVRVHPDTDPRSDREAAIAWLDRMCADYSPVKACGIR